MTKPTTYPYTAWVLQPSFKPKEVTFVKHYEGWSGEDYGCKSESGRVYRRVAIHATKTAAITFGNAEVRSMQLALDKKQGSLNKKREALTKAAQ